MNNMQKSFKRKSALRCMAEGGAVYKSDVNGVPTFSDAPSSGTPYTPGAPPSLAPAPAPAPPPAARISPALPPPAAKISPLAIGPKSNLMGMTGGFGPTPAPMSTYQKAGGTGAIGSQPSSIGRGRAEIGAGRAPIGAGSPPIGAMSPPIGAMRPEIGAGRSEIGAPRMGALGRPIMTSVGYASGGKVRGPGGPTEDKIPAMLSDGEYVLPADTVKKVGVQNLDALKDATHTPSGRSKLRGNVRKFAVGGYVQSAEEIRRAALEAQNRVQQGLPAPGDRWGNPQPATKVTTPTTNPSVVRTAGAMPAVPNKPGLIANVPGGYSPPTGPNPLVVQPPPKPAVATMGRGTVPPGGPKIPLNTPAEQVINNNLIAQQGAGIPKQPPQVTLGAAKPAAAPGAAPATTSVVDDVVKGAETATRRFNGVRTALELPGKAIGATTRAVGTALPYVAPLAQLATTAGVFEDNTPRVPQGGWGTEVPLAADMPGPQDPNVKAPYAEPYDPSFIGSIRSGAARTISELRNTSLKDISERASDPGNWMAFGPATGGTASSIRALAGGAGGMQLASAAGGALRPDPIAVPLDQYQPAKTEDAAAADAPAPGAPAPGGKPALPEGATQRPDGIYQQGNSYTNVLGADGKPQFLQEERMGPPSPASEAYLARTPEMQFGPIPSGPGSSLRSGRGGGMRLNMPGASSGINARFDKMVADYTKNANWGLSPSKTARTLADIEQARTNALNGVMGNDTTRRGQDMAASSAAARDATGLAQEGMRGQFGLLAGEAAASAAAQKAQTEQELKLTEEDRANFDQMYGDKPEKNEAFETYAANRHLLPDGVEGVQQAGAMLGMLKAAGLAPGTRIEAFGANPVTGGAGSEESGLGTRYDAAGGGLRGLGAALNPADLFGDDNYYTIHTKAGPKKVARRSLRGGDSQMQTWQELLGRNIKE